MSAAGANFCVVSVDTLGVTRVVGVCPTPRQAAQEVDLFWDTVATDGERVMMIPSTHPRLTRALSKLAVC